MRYLIDTDIAIELLRNRDRELAMTVAQHDEISLSVISVFELQYGAAHSNDPRAQSKVDALLAVVNVLPFDVDAAVESGRVRAELARNGQQIGPYDRLIAGHARSLGMTLVTRNVREFERVPGLLVEAW